MDKVNNHRNTLLDILRIVAFLGVYLDHFGIEYNDYYVHVSNAIKFFTRTFTGKFGVCVFAVCLGVLAASTNKASLSQYVIMRYLFFFYGALITNGIIYVLIHINRWPFQECSFGQMIQCSINLGADLFPAYWCMQSFLLGSILVQLNCRAKAGIVVCIAEIGILYMMGLVFASVCMMGYVVYLIVPKLERYRVTLPCLAGLALVSILTMRYYLYSLPEIRIKYFSEGVLASVIVCFVIILNENIPWSNKIVLPFTRNYMAMYLLHYIVYKTIGAWLFDHLDGYFLYWKVCVICLAIIIVLSWPLKICMDKMMKLSVKVFEKISLRKVIL